MQFKKYNSIENTYQQRFIEKSFYALDWYDDFIVQEKIHWANFWFYVSKDWIRCAKRTWFILENESFFNYKKILQENELRLLNLQVDIWKDIIVFWELFWWWVQKWIFYSDEQLFYAFDIIVDWEYLNCDDCNYYFEKHWFIYAKTLYRWSLENCFMYDIKKNSILENEISNSWCVEWSNIMEWIVIRPNITKYTNWWERIIFKKKNELFSEKKAPDKIQFDMSKFEEYEQYITTWRLQSVLSKEWEILLKWDCPKYAWIMVWDIEQDCVKDWLELSKQAKKYLFNKCIKFILSNMF